MQFQLRTHIPCHVKLDTETALQTFTNKEALEKLHPNRKALNDAVWERLLNIQKVSRKMWKFQPSQMESVEVQNILSQKKK